MSMWHHASAAALKGVEWVHGIAFGSPEPQLNQIRNATLYQIIFGQLEVSSL